MLQFGGKPNKSSSSDSKRHFAVIMGGKEHGRYVSSTPSSAAKKAITKLCTSNKVKKVEFHIREITQGSKKKTYGPYIGYIEKLKEPIELKGRVIKYKPVAKLSGKSSSKKGGAPKATKATKATKSPNTRNNTSIYYVTSNNNNNNIGNPAAGPAPVGIYNYVPNNFGNDVRFPEPSAPRLENINNNLRNHLEGLAGPAPVFYDFNKFNNPAAGPARAGPAHQHSNDFNNFNNPAAGPARAGPAQQHSNDFNNFNNPAAGPAPIISAPVSRRRRVPEYAFGNHTDPNFKKERNKHRTDPNYIAYKQKIKNYATSKKDLREINSDFFGKKIEEFLKKNYEFVFNTDVKKAYQAMKTYKKAEEGTERKANDPLRIEWLQKYKEYKEAEAELPDNNLDLKKRKLWELRSELGRASEAMERSRKKDEKRKHRMSSKYGKKFFITSPSIYFKGKIVDIDKKQYPKFLDKIGNEELELTKEELISLNYWLAFVKWHGDHTRNDCEDWYENNPLTYEQSRNIIIKGLHKLFKYINEKAIDETYNYIFRHKSWEKLENIKKFSKATTDKFLNKIVNRSRRARVEENLTVNQNEYFSLFNH
jgi:hypothetical protein